jgi:hypothetical protein
MSLTQAEFDALKASADALAANVEESRVATNATAAKARLAITGLAAAGTDAEAVLAQTAIDQARTNEAKAAATTLQAQVETLRPRPWWELWPEGPISPSRPLAKPNRAITFYHRDGTPFSPQPLLDSAGQPRVITWTMYVVERVSNLLKVLDREGTVNDWFVKAQDVQPA